jgi:hypothetical protein
VIAATIVRNYGATNVAPSQKDKSLLSMKERLHFLIYKPSWNKRKFRSWVPKGPETGSDCMDEEPQQFSELDWARVPWDSERRISVLASASGNLLEGTRTDWISARI